MSDPTKWNNRTTSETVCETFSGNIKDRTILLTGPTITGIGFAVCKALIVHQPKLLILAGRSQSKWVYIHSVHTKRVLLSNTPVDRKCYTSHIQMITRPIPLISWRLILWLVSPSYLFFISSLILTLSIHRATSTTLKR